MTAGMTFYKAMIYLSVSLVTTQFTTVAAGPNWGEVGDNGCIVPGIRSKYARLNGLNSIGGKWNENCLATPITIDGQTFVGERTKCIDKGIGGEWGEWEVLDTSCNPRW